MICEIVSVFKHNPGSIMIRQRQPREKKCNSSQKPGGDQLIGTCEHVSTDSMQDVTACFPTSPQTIYLKRYKHFLKSDSFLKLPL